MATITNEVSDKMIDKIKSEINEFNTNNKNLKYYIINNTGHFPGTVMMKETLNKLIELAKIN